MMKKSILSSTTLLFSILAIALSTSCNQAARNQEDNTSGSLMGKTDAQQIASGDKWLKSIFQCPLKSATVCLMRRKCLPNGILSFITKSSKSMNTLNLRHKKSR